jgi:hypothetical protein
MFPQRDNSRRACPLQIGVLGASACKPDIEELAYQVGAEIARQGAVLLCGGLGGVMEAAARGAREHGGTTVGILPGLSAEEANPFIDLRIVTHIGHARNVVLVRSSDAVIAVSGGYGTLSEIAIALKIGIPCIGLRTWDLGLELVSAREPVEAVRLAMEKIRERGVL